MCVVIFLYFFRPYKLNNVAIEIAPNQVATTSPQTATLDPWGIKDLLPIKTSAGLGFKLCLWNNNMIYFGDKLFDPKNLPEELKESGKVLGAIAVKSSVVPELNLYMERGDHGCISVKAEDLLRSNTLINEVNTGMAVLYWPVEGTSKATTTALITPASIDMKSTILYMRINHLHFSIISFAMFTGWFGFVLLLNQVIQFIRPSKKQILHERDT